MIRLGFVLAVLVLAAASEFLWGNLSSSGQEPTAAILSDDLALLTAVPGVGKLRLKTRRFQPVTDCPHAIGSRRRSQYLRVPRPTRTLSRITGPSP